MHPSPYERQRTRLLLRGGVFENLGGDRLVALFQLVLEIIVDVRVFGREQGGGLACKPHTNHKVIIAYQPLITLNATPPPARARAPEHLPEMPHGSAGRRQKKKASDCHPSEHTLLVAWLEAGRL